MHFATWKYKYASDKEMYFMNGRASAIFPQKKKKKRRKCISAIYMCISNFVISL